MSKLNGRNDEFGREGHQVDQENLWGYARGWKQLCFGPYEKLLGDDSEELFRSRVKCNPTVPYQYLG